MALDRPTTKTLDAHSNGHLACGLALGSRIILAFKSGDDKAFQRPNYNLFFHFFFFFFFFFAAHAPMWTVYTVAAIISPVSLHELRRRQPSEPCSHKRHRRCRPHGARKGGKSSLNALRIPQFCSTAEFDALDRMALEIPPIFGYPNLGHLLH